MSEHIRYIEQTDWEEVVLKGDKVIVDFYSTECPPCEALAAKFEPLSELYGHAVTFVKIFRQKNRELAESLGIKSSPSVLFYDKGQRVGDFLTGAIKRSALVRNLNALLLPDQVHAIEAQTLQTTTHTDVLILGGGPAGLTAAIYAAQAKADTLVVDTALPGGQISITHQVSNYPGFIDPLPGFMLSHYMSEQAAKAGAKFKSAVDLTSVNLKTKEVVLDGIETIKAKRIILATGAAPKPLGIPGEEAYRGKGISYCATCDAKYFQDKEVIVIGGGDTALEESLFIAKFVSKLTIVYRGDKLRAKKSIQEAVQNTPNIHLLPLHKPCEFIRNHDQTMSVILEESDKGTRHTLTADGIFVFVGMQPNTQGFGADLSTDTWGYITVDQTMRTSLPAIFAAGDVAEKSIRQITVAVAEGTIAAIHAVKGL